MCSRPVTTGHASVPVQSETPSARTVRIYKSQQEYMAELESIAQKNDLAHVHQNNVDTPGIPPNARHASAEQQQNLFLQQMLKEMQSIEETARKIQTETPPQANGTPSMGSPGTKDQEKELKHHHKALREKVDSPALPSGASNPDRSKITSTTISTTSTSSEAQSTRSYGSSSASSSTTDQGKAPKKAGTSSVSAQLTAAKASLQEIERSLAKLKQPTSQLDSSESPNEQIQQLEKDAADYRKTIKLLESFSAGHSLKSGETANVSTLSSLVRTKTAQRPNPDADAQTSPPDHGNDEDNVGHSNVAAAYKSAKSLELSMPEEHLQRFREKDASKIRALEEKMNHLATKTDEAFEKYQQLQAAVQRDRSEKKIGPHTMKAKVRKLEQYKVEWLQCAVKLHPLMQQWDSFVEHVDPAPAKSAKQRVADQKAFVEKYKSDKTRELETTWNSMVAELQESAENDLAYNDRWDNIAGAVGFAVSFMIGNTIGRFVPGGAWVGNGISALAHVMIATPIVKNLMYRTWSADSLAELNNHVKLRGSQWADQRHGETGIRKYASKNPDRADKLTIDERLAEEKSLSELIGNRYKDEEAAYWMYT